jgi:hypothetical protein
MPRRNDVFLNNYNPTFTLGWRANTDMNRCTNSHAVVEYIAKYASKAETQSRSYHEIFNNVVSTVAPGTARHPLLTTATKMLNSPVVERDWSAQEISHILLGYPLVSSSRQFENLDLTGNHVNHCRGGLDSSGRPIHA